MFEREIKNKSNESALISYKEATDLASSSGIFDSKEVLDAVRFLNDLGSLQYFENDSLKDKVIIDPQVNKLYHKFLKFTEIIQIINFKWIVDVMACVVSVKESPIKEGRMYHKNLKEIWKNYPDEFHSWMLNLTEIFDLTFAVAEQKMNIVPCLLPGKNSFK